MIEGLKVDLTADELTRLLKQRIDHHRDIADDCVTRRVRLQTVTTPHPDDTEEQLAAAWPAYLDNLERRAERHRDRAEALQFLREHLVVHEIYRLGEEDLAMLRLWPQDTTVRTGEGAE
jgi:hypothetical protein